jgi:hypothetical protein
MSRPPAGGGCEAVTASEFAFLALGLLLGVLAGAALVEVLRSRPPAPREVRLTVTPDSVPRRRATTLAEDAFALPGNEPATGGPGDRRLAEGAAAAGSNPRTPVRSPLAPAGAGDARPSLPASALSPSAGGVGAAGAVRASIAVPVHREPDWTLDALRGHAAASAEQAIRDQRMTAAAVLDRPAASSQRIDRRSRPRAARAPTASVAAAERGAEPMPRAEGAGEAGSPAADGGMAVPTAGREDDGCAEVRRVAEERCNVAAIARSKADDAHDALRAAQRAYDDHAGRVEEASLAADPRAIRAAKETAQHAFREARAAATTAEAVESAARDWLTEINRINHAARDAAASVQRERDAANALVATIERLTVEADAARIASEAAAEACVAAREAVAECQEAATLADRATASGWPATPSVGQGGGRPGPWEEESELEAAFSATGAGEPAILRLLRGDRPTLGRLVAELAGEDPAERRRWQLALAGLVDAIVARSIEASALTFPLEHPFWGSFTLVQNRDIVGALSSLGYRFDGLGGWADGRIPSQRDLSLAVGYAGLDPMRIRHWPSEADMETLFAEVAVAADEYLADAAGGLTLGELISLLGRRADPLAELWNEWGKVRPLLLAGG